MESYPQVFKPLKEFFEERGNDCVLTTVDDTPMLRAVVPLLEDGRGLVIMEIFSIDYCEGTELLNLYTTMTKDNGPGMENLRKAANDWNLDSMAGGYGVYGQPGELFHRHTLALATELPQAVKDQMALEALYITMDEVTRRLPDAIRILNGRA